MTQDASQPAPDFADAFDEWIAGATVSKRSVVIYGKHGLVARYESLKREHEAAEQMSQESGEMAGGEAARIEREMTALYDEFQASKATWVIRALTEPEQEAVEAAVEAPKPIEPARPRHPLPLDSGAPKAAQDEHKQALKDYETAMGEYATKLEAFERTKRTWQDEYNYRWISAAVESITFANGRQVPSITYEQIKGMAQKLGQRQVAVLVLTASTAIYEEPTIPAPFSPTSSGSAQT